MSAKVILLVEDDKDIRMCLTTLLHTLGYEVAEAEHGLKAIEWLKSREFVPAGIILDLMMPVMDGHEFLRHLRSSLPQFSSVPIIILSAKEDFNEIVDDIPGINARIAKPFVLTEFINAMENAFGKPGAKND